MKLCIDCKHYSMRNVTCGSPDSYNKTPSPVDGKDFQFNQNPYALRKNPAWCGPEGDWWESRETNKPL